MTVKEGNTERSKGKLYKYKRGMMPKLSEGTVEPKELVVYCKKTVDLENQCSVKLGLNLTLSNGRGVFVFFALVPRE